jgi:phage replication O-like protein O
MGYVKLPNELFDYLCTIEIAGRKRQVFDFIYRKTIGYNKEKDWISLSQISSVTGIDKSDVCKILKDLKKSNMIIRDKKGQTSIQNDYLKWGLPVVRLPVVKNPTASGKESYLPVARLPHTKDNTTKDTPTKDNHDPAGSCEVFLDESDLELCKAYGINEAHALEKKKQARAELTQLRETTDCPFSKGNWSGSELSRELIEWDGRRVNTSRPAVVAAFYFLKFHRYHRSVTELEYETTRLRDWNKEVKEWMKVASLDPEDGFVTTAICDMANKDQTIEEIVPFFRSAKNTYQGYEI